MSVLLGYGNGSFANKMIYETGIGPQSIAIGDFNNDTQMDVVVGNVVSNNISVLLGYGNGSFANQVTYSTGTKPFSVAIGGFNKDTILDLVVVNAGDNNVMILLGGTNEAFVKQTMLPTIDGSRPRSFAIADFNNDNQMDICIANSGINSIGVFIGHGNISFANHMIYSTGLYSSPYSLAVGHFNNDTRLDIVVTNYGSDNVGIFIGCGNGSFSNQTTYSTGSSSFPYSVAVIDFNNDTILDIVVANYGNNKLGVLLGYGDGTFANIILFSMEYGSHPFSVVVGDFNSDRKVDLAVANNGTDSLSIFLQTC
jgi:hypothetical protein